MGSEEKTKLRTILNYWIEHNKEHSQEFREWSEKTRVSGDIVICDEILQAAQELDKVNDFLSRALKKLEETVP